MLTQLRRKFSTLYSAANPSYFEPMESRVLMSGVRAAPKLAFVPVVSIATIDASAAESAKGNQNAAFKVSRSGGDTSQDLVVYYTIGGTATNGSDYQTLSGQVTILAGKSSAQISVKPIDDAESESAETVQLTLAANNAYTIKNATTKSATIKDWEVAPESILGTSFDATVKTATGSLAGSSGFKIFIASENTKLTDQDDSDSSTIPFGILSKKGNAWDTAEVKYTRISSTQATITTTELFDLGIVTGTLTFINANTATYEFTAANGSTITGKLTRINTSFAPSGLDSWSGKGSASSGDGSTFATHGSFSFSTVSDDSYTITTGGASTTGSITSVRRLNDRAFIVDGKDDTLGHNVEAILEFSSAKKATYFLTDHTGSQTSYWGYQRGTVSFATAPNSILTGNTAGGTTSGSVSVLIHNDLPTHAFPLITIISATGTTTNYNDQFGDVGTINIIADKGSKYFNLINSTNFADIMNGFTDGRDALTTRIVFDTIRKKITLDSGNRGWLGVFVGSGNGIIQNNLPLIFTYDQDSSSWLASDETNLADLNPTFAKLIAPTP